MNDEAVYRTALATPGLLKNLPLNEVLGSVGVKSWLTGSVPGYAWVSYQSNPWWTDSQTSSLWHVPGYPGTMGVTNGRYSLLLCLGQLPKWQSVTVRRVHFGTYQDILAQMGATEGRSSGQVWITLVIGEPMTKVRYQLGWSPVQLFWSDYYDCVCTLHYILMISVPEQATCWFYYPNSIGPPAPKCTKLNYTILLKVHSIAYLCIQYIELLVTDHAG